MEPLISNLSAGNLDHILLKLYGTEQLAKKTLTVLCYGKGNVETPIYFKDIKAVEMVSDVELGSFYLLEREEENALPDGVSAIECPESPWLKKK